MKRYIVLLRGINISGKNKIPMSELKEGFTELSYMEFYDEIGNPKAECEKVHSYKNMVFWSFKRKDYKKTNWWSKTASAKVSSKITIQTANTVRKIVCL